MIIRKKVFILLLSICSLNVWAKELDPELVFSSALEKDITMKNLLLEKETALLNIAVEDHKDGILLRTGLDQAGTASEKLGKSASELSIQPFAELKLPETAGTTVRADLPIMRLFGKSSMEMAAGLSLKQDISSLLGMEPQEKAKLLRRNISEREFQLRIKTRRAEIEQEVLELTKSLLNLEKNLISNKTSLDEKETLLNNMLNAGMIARNSSTHLSNLMEIRELESEAEKLKTDYTATLSDYERLTGIKVLEAPSFPVIETPKVIPGTEPDSVKTSELNLELRKAELDDYNAAVPPKFSLNAAGRRDFSGDNGLEVSGGAGAVFEDFSVSVNGAWNEEEGGSLSAGISLGFKDESLKLLNSEIFRHNIESAAMDLEICRQAAQETVRNINTETRRIETSEKNLKINAEFIRKYLDEMEIKYQHGLIRELELVKARDQEKIVELDTEILNIDRYLLLNTIRSQIDKM